MAEGGLVPPHSVLAPGTALGLLPSSGPILRPGQRYCRRPEVVVEPDKPERREEERRFGPVVRSELPCGNLRSLPFGPTRGRTVDAAASVSNGRGQQHDALDGVALTVRNSHQIRPHLPWSNTGQSCSRLSRAAPCEGMCWEQSRRQRTIATSRGDDNRDEP